MQGKRLFTVVYCMFLQAYSREGICRGLYKGLLSPRKSARFLASRSQGTGFRYTFKG